MRSAYRLVLYKNGSPGNKLVIVDSDPGSRNLTALTVSKNRYSGKTGPAGTLIFNPATFSYKEAA